VDLAGLYDDDNDPNTPEIIVENKPEVWSITKLFTAGRHFVGSGTADRRFFNRPDVVQTRDEQGPYDAVIIGSGDREDPNGALITNWLYMIKDRKITSGDPPTTTLGHDDLADLTSNCLQSGTLSSCGIETSLFVNGWRIQLETPGEKNLAGAITVGGSIFFTTFIPAATASTCSLNEGEGRLYALGLQDGTAVMNFDTTNDDTGTTYERSDKLASGGIPVEVIPIGQGKLLAQGQEAGANIIPAGGRTSFRTYWYELPR
jgi:type IV pilus assembly protein PilY1